MRFRSGEAASATGGRLHGPDVWIEGASFDSRSLRPGSLFVPIVAARDGHDHIADSTARSDGRARPAVRSASG